MVFIHGLGTFAGKWPVYHHTIIRFELIDRLLVKLGQLISGQCQAAIRVHVIFVYGLDTLSGIWPVNYHPFCRLSHRVAGNRAINHHALFGFELVNRFRGLEFIHRCVDTLAGDGAVDHQAFIRFEFIHGVGGYVNTLGLGFRIWCLANLVYRLRFGGDSVPSAYHDAFAACFSGVQGRSDIGYTGVPAAEYDTFTAACIIVIGVDGHSRFFTTGGQEIVPFRRDGKAARSRIELRAHGAGGGERAVRVDMHVIGHDKAGGVVGDGHGVGVGVEGGVRWAVQGHGSVGVEVHPLGHEVAGVVGRHDKLAGVGHVGFIGQGYRHAFHQPAVGSGSHSFREHLTGGFHGKGDRVGSVNNDVIG